ncbi:salt-inducible protein kinase [Thecamonas trahens ATCC 50062]|uniref:Salt-inducible protein kinase n=1 Tax=Thecamonas trahens ATCC 50062 TaxID=461836 RepID=A0A0L0DSR4_THETB|nr:salt-inducible protein kinase [Thecamonas trahens ATCC 50062]KNC54498.1 salt-inducible protein kinase [Thecamonas trahens ATCC 50062]|eukprot:XP_013753651.1 salt-inducible protein kinase [Thecamonas trahens ATCC 50062]
MYSNQAVTSLGLLSVASSISTTSKASSNWTNVFWSAPEVLAGGADAVAPSSDIYSFAIVLWELLTRDEPYHPTSGIAALALEVVHGTSRPALVNIPPWAADLVPLVASAWDHLPRERPSAAALASTLCSRFTLAKVQLPVRKARPSGHVFAATISCPSGKALLAHDPLEARRALHAFHDMLASAVAASRASLVDWALGDALVVFDLPRQLLDFADACYDALAAGHEAAHPPFFVVAAEGDITSELMPGTAAADHQWVFRGPVVCAMASVTEAAAAAGRNYGFFVDPGLKPSIKAALSSACLSVPRPTLRLIKLVPGALLELISDRCDLSCPALGTVMSTSRAGGPSGSFSMSASPMASRTHLHAHTRGTSHSPSGTPVSALLPPAPRCPPRVASWSNGRRGLMAHPQLVERPQGAPQLARRASESSVSVVTELCPSSAGAPDAPGADSNEPKPGMPDTTQLKPSPPSSLSSPDKGKVDDEDEDKVKRKASQVLPATDGSGANRRLPMIQLDIDHPSLSKTAPNLELAGMPSEVTLPRLPTRLSLHESLVENRRLGKRTSSSKQLSRSRSRQLSRSRSASQLRMALTLASRLKCELVLSVPVMRSMIMRGSEAGASTVCRMLVSNYKGMPVVIKSLLSQGSVTVKPLVTLVTELASWALLPCEVREIFVVPVGVCATKPFVGVVLPFYRLGSLGSAIRDGRRSAVFVNTAVRSVAHGLAVLHNHDIVHGALRPNNVMLKAPDASQTVFVDGCGLNRLLAATGQAREDPGLAGLAPELADGTATEPTPASDIFAFGCLVYELLTGKPAFGASTEALLAARVMPDDMDSLSPDMASLLYDCWARQPASRLSTKRLVDRIVSLPIRHFTLIPQDGSGSSDSE